MPHGSQSYINMIESPKISIQYSITNCQHCVAGQRIIYTFMAFPSSHEFKRLISKLGVFLPNDCCMTLRGSHDIVPVHCTHHNLKISKYEIKMSKYKIVNKKIKK